MSHERFDSVWDAIEDTPAQAENMRLRSSLMMALKQHISREGLTQSQAAKVFGVTQPRVSDLIRGKIELFGLDSLVNMAGRRWDTGWRCGWLRWHDRDYAASTALCNTALRAGITERRDGDPCHDQGPGHDPETDPRPARDRAW